MGFIYKLTFPSEKSYIGQTIRDIHKRLEEHPVKPGCSAVYNAIKKYGWENVKKEWYEVPDEDLNFYEEMLVPLLGTLAPGGYNLMEGGGATGKPSEESKQRMSEAHTGKTHTDETKKKQSEAKSGEKHPNYGKTSSEETKKKMSEALSGEKAYNSKRVYQYTLDGTYIDSYGSSGEAARALGKTDGSLIKMCARGKRPTAYGFKWTREKF
jgi:group I intron endonuclease